MSGAGRHLELERQLGAPFCQDRFEMCVGLSNLHQDRSIVAHIEPAAERKDVPFRQQPFQCWHQSIHSLGAVHDPSLAAHTTGDRSFHRRLDLLGR